MRTLKGKARSRNEIIPINSITYHPPRSVLNETVGLQDSRECKDLQLIKSGCERMLLSSANLGVRRLNGQFAQLSDRSFERRIRSPDGNYTYQSISAGVSGKYSP